MWPRVWRAVTSGGSLTRLEEDCASRRRASLDRRVGPAVGTARGVLGVAAHCVKSMQRVVCESGLYEAVKRRLIKLWEDG